MISGKDVGVEFELVDFLGIEDVVGRVVNQFSKNLMMTPKGKAFRKECEQVLDDRQVAGKKRYEISTSVDINAIIIFSRASLPRFIFVNLYSPTIAF